MRDSISVSLPENMKGEIDEFSRMEGISRSDLVREALREYLFVRRFRTIRHSLIPYAEAQGVYTDEDVFREIS